MTLILNKPLCVIQSPLETRSGYGDMARDIARHIIDLDIYEVLLVTMPWGQCPMNALDPVRDGELIKRIHTPPVNLPRPVDLFIQISVPNEFQPVGKYNVGITAGIETTAISHQWIQGCNRMNVIWTISEHSRAVITNTKLEERNQLNQVVAIHSVTVPVEILHNCVHTDIFKKISSEEISTKISDLMIDVREKFCFLFVGHWLQGNIGEDRKNVGMLIKIFCETFKTTSTTHRPALLLKASGAGFSILDREEILNKIKQIRASVGNTCPNVYLIHGHLTETEMNELYNHPRIKAHVSFTKGEGFGRPLLEATMSGKPVIASGWSGHLDFLTAEEAILVPGEIRQVEPGAVWDGVIVKESGWFNIDHNQAANALMWVYKNYDQFLLPAKRLAKKNKDLFNYDAIKKRTADLIEKYVPKPAAQVPIVLPTLKKINRPVATLPKVTEPTPVETVVASNETSEVSTS